MVANFTLLYLKQFIFEKTNDEYYIESLDLNGNAWNNFTWDKQ